MSKKKFTEGLESLFRDVSRKEDNVDGVMQEETQKKPVDPSVLPKKRSAGSKDFSNDLQSFLQSAFEESYERQTQTGKTTKDFSKDIKKRQGKPMSGLDALIRATVEPSKMSVDPHNIKRLTVAFEVDKLQKLKKIARMEKSYLKDIIDDIVEKYIRTYEEQKGKL